jgi:hypothetical protein
MSRGFKRCAAVLLLVAALTNGLFGPMAHGHMVAGAAQGDEQRASASVDASMSHGSCHAEEPDDEGTAPPGAKHPGNSGMLCSGSSACCAAVAVLELPTIHYRERVTPRDSLRPVLAGLSPPVGERPPSPV